MSRDRIVRRIRSALAGRDAVVHPGPFLGWRDESASQDTKKNSILEQFQERFTAAGGEVVTLADLGAVTRWLGERWPAEEWAVGPGWRRLHADPKRGPGSDPPADQAAVGVSVARGAVAETGSLLLGSEDDRRVQLLPPVHVVLVWRESVHATLAEALEAHRTDLSSGLGLHSGPSKSADIGQVLVEGVHGPGRVVAILVTDLE